MTGTSKDVFKSSVGGQFVCCYLWNLPPSAAAQLGNSVGKRLSSHSALPSFHSHPPSHTSLPESLRVDEHCVGGFKRWALKSRLDAAIGDRNMKLRCCLDESTCKADVSFEEKPDALRDFLFFVCFFPPVIGQWVASILLLT